MALNSGSTRNKLHVSASMRGTQNRVNSSFAEDLAKDFPDDPEMQAWIEANKKGLNSPNADGSIPFGADRLDDYERNKARAAEPTTDHCRDRKG